jgi:Flp pilus assembly protein TadG
MGILDWLKQAGKKERAVRYSTPGIVAHYWDGGAPQKRVVKDISLTGAYLYASERWWTGTVIDMSFKDEGGEGETMSSGSALGLRCKVVRESTDGIGVTFMLRTREEQKALKQFMCTTVLSAAVPGKRRAAEQGQALIEYALMVPFLFLLIVNCVNFGAFVYDWIVVANASRTGAEYAIRGNAAAGGLAPPTATQISTLITNDMKSIPGTPTISVCENNNGTLTTLTGTCSSTGTWAVPADPEAPSYVLVTVDVSYTYTPLTGTLKFPGLRIYATIPPTTIHRRAVMRAIQ